MDVLGAINKVKLQTKAHSPEILIVAGIAGVVVSAVMACKATLKAPEIVEEHKKEMEEVRAQNEESEEANIPESTAKTYARTGLKLVKLYGPSVALGIISIGCIVHSNNILRNRNASLAAAYMVVDKGFKEYRSRVVERFGEEVDHQLRSNVREIEVEEKTVDGKGKEKTKKQKIRVADPESEGGFLKYFTPSNGNWSNSPDLNDVFFRIAMENANGRLMANGFITLNDVYEILGFQKTKAGMIIGWIYDPKNPTGDNRVIFDIEKVCVSDENGHFQWGYAVDFNPDGNIYDLMK